MRAGAKDSGAFLPAPVVMEGSGSGPLEGYTFAVKDIFDVRHPRAVSLRQWLLLCRAKPAA